MNAGEQPPLADLARNLDEYWRRLDPVFQWTPARRHADGFGFLRDEVFPRRMTMLGVADQIQTENERQMSTGDQRVAALFTEFQTRLTATLGLTVLLGLLLAAFSTRRILSLEHQTDERFHEVTEARGQLKDLSARLVQVQEQERRSLSQELHDEVGQSLSALLIGLSNLSAAIGSPAPDQVESEIGALRRIVESTVREVRNITLLLRPSMLDDLGLLPALEWQAREVSRQNGLIVNVAASGVPDNLPDEYKTCIYRVTQEALHNIARHAGAATVRVLAQCDANRLMLSIQDDGRGFDVARTRGLGLLGMQERVEHLGGTLQVTSEPGNGTLVSAVLPLIPR
jgi:signal transduction histidine kinase